MINVVISCYNLMNLIKTKNLVTGWGGNCADDIY